MNAFRSGRRRLHGFALLWLTMFALAAAWPQAIGFAAPRNPVEIQLLNVSDWHAQFDPINVPGVGNVGGAAVLSSYWKADRAANPNTITLTAGDAFGASPPLSSFFNEEPAIETMNAMGFDVDTFGNHNFDRGTSHLQEMIDLAEFQYVSANLQNVDGTLQGVKPFEIFDVGGVKVAVIGITNPEAPTLVLPGNFDPIVVTDPVKAAKKARAQARRAGARVFVVITHMGVTGRDAAGQPTGPLIDFANAVGGFDVIFGDHTDVQFEGVINNALVLENQSKGVTYARTTLKVDPRSGRVMSKENTFVTPLSSAVTPDPAVESLLAPYRAELAKAYDGKIAEATGIFPRGGTPSVERSGEAAIGNLTADALRWRYGTQLAFTNSGGLRASLPSSYAPLDKTLRRPATGYAAGPPYDLVVGDVFAVLPFGNSVVTRTVTGAQLWAALENGVSQINASSCAGADGRFPQISGFRFTFSCSAAAGARVQSVALTDGTPIPNNAGTSYTFATNNFVNAGGDGYTMLNDGQGVTREVMADVLLDYIRAQGTITPATDGRITKFP